MKQACRVAGGQETGRRSAQQDWRLIEILKFVFKKTAALHWLILARASSLILAHAFSA